MRQGERKGKNEKAKEEDRTGGVTGGYRPRQP